MNVSDKKQSDRFEQAARDLGCDGREEAFDEALKKVARHKPKEPPPERQDKPKGKKPGQ